jgi:hypothetical protein
VCVKYNRPCIVTGWGQVIHLPHDSKIESEIWLKSMKTSGLRTVGLYWANCKTTVSSLIDGNIMQEMKTAINTKRLDAE